MIRLRVPIAALLFAGAFQLSVDVQDSSEKFNLRPSNPQGWAEYEFVNRIAHGTNGVIFTYGGSVLSADSMTVDEASGQIFADGGVRIQREEQLWVGEHIIYNFKTRQMEAREFRTGKPPIFVAGEGLHGETISTNQVRPNPTNLLFRATNAFLTIEDISDPDVKIRAKSITIL